MSSLLYLLRHVKCSNVQIFVDRAELVKAGNWNGMQSHKAEIMRKIS